MATTSNRLTQTQDVGGIASISYDAAGHITNDGTNSYTYSDRGRMASATTAGGTVTYVYNGLNQRAGKSGPTSLVPTGTAYYLYDEAGQLLGEYDANGAPINETIYLGGMPVGALKQTGSAGTNDIAVTLYNVHADHIATARVITKQDHTIVWRWDTAEAFGATAPDQNPSSLGTFTFNQRFPGQVFDSETGLFQNWNREYNARQGRYIQSDPIGLDGGINTYLYVSGKPLTRIDPTGFIDLDIGGARELTLHANPGPNATDFRPEHNPPHFHMGGNDGPRWRTDTWEPYSKADAERMTRQQRQYCEGMSEETRNLVRSRQQEVFTTGHFTRPPSGRGGRGGGGSFPPPGGGLGGGGGGGRSFNPLRLPYN